MNDLPPITIATNIGPHVIQPVVVAGDLALHLRPGTDDIWTLTHVPSGWAIIDLLELRETAETVLHELAALDWSGAKQLTWLDRDAPIVKAVNYVFDRYKTLQKEEMHKRMERDPPRWRSSPMDRYR